MNPVQCKCSWRVLYSAFDAAPQTPRANIINIHELMEYFSRDGKPCPYGVWSEMLADCNYREVQVDDLPNGTRVETCWLGVDGRSFYLRPRPIDRHLIFYTMVLFPKTGRRKRENKYFRYATEREARAGHNAAVRKFGPGRKRLRHSVVPRQGATTRLR